MIKFKYYLLFTMISMVLILFFSCDLTETEPVDYHNKILFTSSRSGKKQLYIMNPDGTDIQQVTSGAYWHSDGKWSPDAERIVCNTEEGTTTAGIEMVVINSDGTNRKLLTWGGYMSWSPDGNKIAFIRSPYAEFGLRCRFIYIIDSDGSNTIKITNDSLEIIGSPIWSHNGEDIFFTSNRHNTANYLDYEIYKMNIDGSKITRLTYTIEGRSYSPSISPSGEKVVFMCARNNAQKGSIYAGDIDFSNFQLIISPPDCEIYNLPQWSPDEQSIIFIGVTTDGNGRSSVYKIGIDGKNLIKLIEDSDSVDWSN